MRCVVAFLLFMEACSGGHGLAPGPSAPPSTPPPTTETARAAPPPGAAECQRDDDCVLSCPTPDECCAGLCSPCGNAVPRAELARFQARTKAACPSPCIVGCAHHGGESHAVCAAGRCQGRVTGRPSGPELPVRPGPPPPT